jgi:hypothetical protein
VGRPGAARGRPGRRCLADSLATYWDAALEPYWPQVRALLEADLLYRSRRLTEGGPTALFADLDPAVHWREHGLDGRSVLYAGSAGRRARERGPLSQRLRFFRCCSSAFLPRSAYSRAWRL